GIAVRKVTRVTGWSERDKAVALYGRCSFREQCMHHRIDRGIAADHQSDKKNRSGAEHRRLPQNAAAVANILQKLFNSRPSPYLANRFLNGGDVTKLTAHRNSCLLCGLASLYPLLNRHLHM